MRARRLFGVIAAVVGLACSGCGGERDTPRGGPSPMSTTGGGLAASSSGAGAAPGAGGSASGGGPTGGGGFGASAGGGGAAAGGGGTGGSAFAGYPLPTDPDPALPTNGTLRVLLWTTPDYDGAAMAATLEQLVVAHPDFSSATIVSEPISSSRLLLHYYGWTGRDARLASLASGWDYVVMGDIYWAPTQSQELFFQAVGATADEIRTSGATPILLSEQDPMPAVDGNGQLCTNTCRFLGGNCDDGGAGAAALGCAFGSDCGDCGPRDPNDAPAEGPIAINWRVAVGTGSVMVHTGPVLADEAAAAGERPHVNAAAIYTALFGVDAGASGYVPAAIASPRWSALTAAVHSRFVADAAAEHYTGSATSAVRVDAMVPDATYRFMTAGTSSEAGYRVAMQGLLDREGWPRASESLGSCNALKRVTPACGDTAITLLGQNVYQSLYARGYEIDASYITNGAMAPDFMAQIYDRHWDSTLNEGIAALDDIYDRAYFANRVAVVRDLAWLPMHLSYGELKIAFPGTQLLSDGVHATATMQAGLAAMSYVSRSGLVASTAGLDAETTFAVDNGERLVRTLATLTRTGLPMADLPANRVVVATP
jgi:hypothetical protein